MRRLLKLLVCLSLLFLAAPVIAQQGAHHLTTLREMDSVRQLLSYKTGVPAFRPPISSSATAKQKEGLPARFLSSVPSSHFGNASSPLCADTSVRTTYSKQAHWVGANFAVSTSDGNILMVGTENDDIPDKYFSDPVLIKMTPYGDTIWMHRLRFNTPFLHNYGYRVFQLRNGNILLAGGVSVPSTVNGREDLLLAMFSANGTLYWEKTFMNSLSRIYPNDGSIYIYDCGEDNAGNIILCGSIRFGSPSDGGLLFSMDKNGTVRWSEKFGTRYYPYFTGMDISNDTIRLFGHFVTDSNLCTLSMMANAANGDTLSATAWQVAGDKGIDTAFYADQFTKLSNGNFAVYGSGWRNYYNPYGISPVTRFGVAEFTPAMKPAKLTVFSSASKDINSAAMSVFSDGSAAYAYFRESSQFTGTWMVGNYENGSIGRERSAPFSGVVPYYTAGFFQLPDGGRLAVNAYQDSISRDVGIEWVKLHNSDTSGSCLGSDTTLTFLQSVALSPARFYIDSIVSNVLIETFQLFDKVTGDTIVTGSNCRQISYCDSLKLIPSFTTLCPNMPVSLTIRKNKACGAFPAFSYDTSAVQSFYRTTDTTLSLTFRKQYQGYISAATNGCKPLSDSVRFTVLQAPPALSLGPDTVLCPGNTVLLNARTGYASYRWQDGSEDSVYTITKPGKYYVTATDACGGSFSDTVIAASHPPIPFDVGPDLSICRGSSVSITAPAGFISYQWSPPSGLSSATAQTVTASPLQDIQYKVTAGQTPGCFASDSFKIAVQDIPLIQLGNDTTLCEGQSLALAAGSGFTSYTWNTGETASSIKVSTQGSVWVKGDLNGCTVADTLAIKAVYPLPRFSLGNDTTLCEGQQLPYSFSFPNASYLWSNGSAAASQTVAGPGRYSLEVTQNGCRYADTVNVSYTPAPVFSLGNDTTLCEGASILLNPDIPGASLRWQDGSTAPGYLVTQGGGYTLAASLGRCSAADTIAVSFLGVPYFSLGKDTFLCSGGSLLLRPRLNVPAAYLWNTGNKASSYTVTAAGTYSLTATGVCGAHSDSINITSVVCQLALPSAFTPGNDGVNDVFRVRYSFPARTFHLSVFNRWGQKVFETSDMSHGWNGTAKGFPASGDTYIWQISYTTLEGKEFHLAGTVVLFR